METEASLVAELYGEALDKMRLGIARESGGDGVDARSRRMAYQRQRIDGGSRKQPIFGKT